MWVIKCKGETYHVSHVECNVPWSTKETPDNSHTKGSIKVRDCLLTINDANEASIKPLTLLDRIRLRNQRLGLTRIIFEWGGHMHRALNSNEFRHSAFKNIEGGCGTHWVVCDLLDKSEATVAALKYRFRVLMPNEVYYQAYDSKSKYIEEQFNEDLDQD